MEVESWGRHRYYRVAGLEIVRAIEALSLISPAKPVRSLRHSWEAEAVRFARTCYDHLAGFLGVKFTRSLVELDVVRALEDGYEVTEAGHLHLLKFGVDLSGARSGCGSRPPTSTGASVTATSPRMPVTTKVPCLLRRCQKARRECGKSRPATVGHQRDKVQGLQASGFANCIDAAWRAKCSWVRHVLEALRTPNVPSVWLTPIDTAQSSTPRNVGQPLGKRWA